MLFQSFSHMIPGWWFQPTPPKNMSSLVGVIIPNIWKNKIHVPNHQPDPGSRTIPHDPIFSGLSH